VTLKTAVAALRKDGDRSYYNRTLWRYKNANHDSIAFGIRTLHSVEVRGMEAIFLNSYNETLIEGYL